MIGLFQHFYIVRYVFNKLKPLFFVSIGIQISFFIISALFGDSGFYFLTISPLSSPFIHSSFSHFTQNFIMLFLFLIPSINSVYDFRKLVAISILLGLTYLPFVLFGFTDPIIGLSGLGYFLMARFVIANQHFRKVVLAIFLLLVVGELSLLGSSDDIAHGFHLFSAGCGALSIYKNEYFYFV